MGFLDAFRPPPKNDGPEPDMIWEQWEGGGRITLKSHRAKELYGLQSPRRDHFNEYSEFLPNHGSRRNFIK
jgi:hypothetical protein